jgi:hypothetical protein
VRVRINSTRRGSSRSGDAPLARAGACGRARGRARGEAWDDSIRRTSTARRGRRRGGTDQPGPHFLQLTDGRSAGGAEGLIFTVHVYVYCTCAYSTYFYVLCVVRCTRSRVIVMCPATTYESTKESTLSVSTEVVLSYFRKYESSFKTVPKVRVRV